MSSSDAKFLLGLGITGSSVLTGFLLTLSNTAIPSVLEEPDLSEKEVLGLWKSVYCKGFYTSPPLAASSAACTFASAYITFTKGGSELKNNALQLLVAGTCMFGVIPYTIIMIAAQNKRMMKRHALLVSGQSKAAESQVSKAEARDLIDMWRLKNFGRMMFPLVGAILSWGVWSSSGW